MVGNANSGNPNPSPETRYGGERENPRYSNVLGNHHESVRKSIQHIARQPATKTEGGKFEIELPTGASFAQAIAAQRIESALNTQDAGDHLRCADYVTEQVDGKLINTNLNAEYAALGSMSLEELHDYRKQLAARREELESTGNRTDAGGGGAAGNPPAERPADAERDPQRVDEA